jgi:HlyD family secretion protein
LRSSLKKATFAVCLALGVLATGCTSATPTPTAPAGIAPAAANKVAVQVAEAKRAVLSNNQVYSGSVQAKQQVTIVPKVSGRVLKVNVDVGSLVKAGDVLVELDHDATAAQVAQAEAGLAAAQARLAGLEAGPRAEQVAQAEANLKAAQARLAQLKAGPTAEQLAIAETQVRLAQNQEYLTQQNVQEMSYRTDGGTSHSPLTPFFSKDIGRAQSGVAWEQTKLAEANLAQLKAGAAPEQVTQLEAAVTVAEQQLALAKQPVTEYDIAAARAAVAQAKAAVDLARVQLVEATVVAPFAGVVSQRSVVEGSMAGPAAPLLTILSADVEVVVNLDEATAAALKPGEQAGATASASPGNTISLTVKSVAPTVDPKARMVQVRLSPSDAKVQLRDGAFVQVHLSGAAAKKEVLTVPSAALVKEQGTVAVYTVADGKAQTRPVTTGLTDGDRVEIVAGLSAGEKVAISGLSALADGQEVAIR